MTARVDRRTAGDVAVLRMVNPPLNAIDAGLRAALAEALGWAATAPGVRAVVLAGEGRNFSAGPPLAEDEPPEAAPTLAELCAAIEDGPRPVVAALAGMALGPGLALALAAHGRVAGQGARVGMPEVTLGLVPRGGSSQRLTRLAGAGPALELMLEGTPIPAAQAAAAGMVDRVADGEDPIDAATAMARDMAAGRVPRRRSRELETQLADGGAHLAEVELARAAVAGTRQVAALRIIDCVEAAALLPWQAALAYEAAAFEACAASDESRALRHLMAAELAADIARPELLRAARAVRELGFLDCTGAGPQIAARALERGLTVTIAAPDGARAVAARDRVRAVAGAERAAKGTLNLAADPGALAAADAVIEAQPGPAQARAPALAELARRLRPQTPLFVLTGAEAAAPPALPRDGAPVFGLGASAHARIMEIVLPGDAAGGDAADAVARALGRLPVLARGRPLAAPLRLAADWAAGWLVDAGLSPAAVDGALRAAGFARGVFAALDAEGLAAARARLLAAAPGRAPLPLIERLLAAGRGGVGDGRGFYLHSAEGPIEDAGMRALLDAHRAETAPAAEVPPQAGTVLARVELAMANAGARLIAAGAATAADIDLVAVHLLGSPRRRGGPMMAADLRGLLAARKALLRYGTDLPEIWDPVPLWLELIANGRSFAGLRHGGAGP